MMTDKSNNYSNNSDTHSKSDYNKNKNNKSKNNKSKNNKNKKHKHKHNKSKSNNKNAHPLLTRPEGELCAEGPLHPVDVRRRVAEPVPALLGEQVLQVRVQDGPAAGRVGHRGAHVAVQGGGGRAGQQQEREGQEEGLHGHVVAVVQH